jgi:peptidoglycan/LPS O-acetylase OafA/YrhL
MLYTGKLSVKTDWEHIIKSYLLIKQDRYPFLFPAWSLVFECFFYIVFGICLFLGFRKSRYVFFAWVALVLFFSIFNNDLHFSLAHSMAFEPYILEFLFGCLIGYLFHNHFHKLRQHADKIYYTGLALAIAVLIGCPFFFVLSAKGSLPVCLLFGSVFSLVVLGSALKDSNSRSHVPELFYTIGEASYSIYLSHQIVLGLIYKKASSVLADHATNPLLIVLASLSFIAAVIAGILIHKYVERNLLALMNRLLLPAKIAKPAL